MTTWVCGVAKHLIGNRDGGLGDCQLLYFKYLCITWCAWQYLLWCLSQYLLKNPQSAGGTSQFLFLTWRLLHRTCCHLKDEHVCWMPGLDTHPSHRFWRKSSGDRCRLLGTHTYSTLLWSCLSFCCFKCGTHFVFFFWAPWQPFCDSQNSKCAQWSPKADDPSLQTSPLM